MYMYTLTTTCSVTHSNAICLVGVLINYGNYVTTEEVLKHVVQEVDGPN